MDEPVAISADRSRSQLDRVDRILDAFDPGHTSLTLLGLVARTGLPKTTVYRTVRRMAALGWVELSRSGIPWRRPVRSVPASALVGAVAFAFSAIRSRA